MGTSGKGIAATEMRSGSLAALAGFIVGALVAIAVLFTDLLVETIVGGTAWERGSVRRPETVVWLTLLTAQAGLWAVAWGASRAVLERLEHGRSRPVAIAGFCLIGVLVVAVVVVPALVGELASPLPLHRPKIIIFFVLGSLVAARWIEATWRIGTIARRVIEQAHAGPDPGAWRATLVDAVGPPGAHPFESYLRLRELLGHAVLILGVIVTGITLTTGALRLAVLAAHKDATFPISSVLVYGGFFSLLLTLIYLPVQLRMIELGNRLRDWAAPVVATDGIDAFKRRGEAEALLHVSAGPVAGVQTGLAILAPLVTALVGALLSAD